MSQGPNILNKLPLPAPPPRQSYNDLELEVGDLVMWDGKPHEHSLFRHGIIYRVMNKREPENTTYMQHQQYQFRAVFDFNRPVGQPIEAFGYSTVRDLKRLSLVDLGVLRMTFDSFIKEWAKQEGADVSEA